MAAVLAEAQDIARSDERVAEAACAAAVTLAWNQVNGGAPAQASFAPAIERCTGVLGLDPSSSSARVSRARACWRWGLGLEAEGKDPRPLLERALADAREAAALAPSDPSVCRAHGTLASELANVEVAGGGDPRRLAAEAREAWERGLALREDPMTRSNLGFLAVVEAEWLAKEGEDPRPLLFRAVEQHRLAIGLAPGFANFHNLLGGALVTQGVWEIAHGLDGAPALREAVAAYQASLAINPNQPSRLVSIGLAYANLADLARMQGDDGYDALHQAGEWLDRAAAPGGATAVDALAFVRALQVEQEVWAGRDPSAACCTGDPCRHPGRPTVGSRVR